jgi:hypothetical protein
MEDNKVEQKFVTIAFELSIFEMYFSKLMHLVELRIQSSTQIKGIQTKVTIQTPSMRELFLKYKAFSF